MILFCCHFADKLNRNIDVNSANCSHTNEHFSISDVCAIHETTSWIYFEFECLPFFLAPCRNQLTLLQREQQCLLSLRTPVWSRHQWTTAVPGGCRGADWCKDWPISVHPAAALTRAPTVAAAVISQTQVSRCTKILKLCV